MSMNKFYSTTEVAKILGISRIAVFKMIKRGALKARRVGNAYLIDEKDILTETNLPESTKKDIEGVVEKAFAQYGEVFKRLAKE